MRKHGETSWLQGHTVSVLDSFQLYLHAIVFLIVHVAWKNIKKIKNQKIE